MHFGLMITKGQYILLGMLLGMLLMDVTEVGGCYLIFMLELEHALLL